MRLFTPLFLFLLFLESCTNPQKQTIPITAADTSLIPIDSFVAPAAQEDTVTAFVEQAKLIIPGKSIGLTSIGEKGDAIAAKLGPPDDGDAAMGKAISTWYAKNDKTRSTTIYFTTNFGDKDEAPRVSQIRITSPYFSTKEKIQVGSNFSAIKNIFGDIKKAGSYPQAVTKKTVNVYDIVLSGIAFEIDDTEKCVGITIHKPGEKAFQTYLNFLPGYEPLP